MTDNRNTILAVILSGLVLIAWQYFYNMPQMEKQRAAEPDAGRTGQARRRQATPGTTPQAGSTPARQRASQPSATRRSISRDAAIAASPRIKIETPSVSGSIALKGARIDDLSLVKFRETVDPDLARDRAVLAVAAPRTPITPSSAGSPAPARRRGCPTRTRSGSRRAPAALTPTSPVTLKYDNGDGLIFRRTIAIDDHYLFTVKDDVTNTAPRRSRSIRSR